MGNNRCCFFDDVVLLPCWLLTLLSTSIYSTIYFINRINQSNLPRSTRCWDVPETLVTWLKFVLNLWMPILVDVPLSAMSRAQSVKEISSACSNGNVRLDDWGKQQIVYRKKKNGTKNDKKNWYSELKILVGESFLFACCTIVVVRLIAWRRVSVCCRGIENYCGVGETDTWIARLVVASAGSRSRLDYATLRGATLSTILCPLFVQPLHHDFRLVVVPHVLLQILLFPMISLM